MPKGEIAGAIGGDDENHLATKTQNLEETIVEFPQLDLQGCSPPGDKPSAGCMQTLWVILDHAWDPGVCTHLENTVL